jgi:hypothetical protein
MWCCQSGVVRREDQRGGVGVEMMLYQQEINWHLFRLPYVSMFNFDWKKKDPSLPLKFSKTTI